MYANAKRRDVQLLLSAGVPQERIQALTGVSVRTIRRIGREAATAEPTAPADAEAPPRAGPGRPSRVEPFREAVAAMLARPPNSRAASPAALARAGLRRWQIYGL